MRAVINVFRVLEEVAAQQPVGVSDLARRLELPKSTVQRALQTLHGLGWIEPEPTGARRWVQSTKLLALASRGGGLGLRELALPVMRELLDEADENVHLSVRSGNWVAIIEKLESSKTVRPFDRLGELAPIHASSTGKAILAWSTSEEVEALIGTGLQKFTERTLVDPGALREDLEAARQVGYVVNRCEWRDDVGGVAAPVIDQDGRPVAAISIAVPAHRLPEHAIPRLAGLVAAKVAKLVIPGTGSPSPA